MKLKLFCYIILIPFLLSCEDVFNQRILLEIDPGKEKLVVLSEINTNSPPNILLSLSGNNPSDLYMERGSYKPGPEAEVDFYENGKHLGRMSRNSNSVYTLDYFFLPSPEKTYELKARTKEFDEVWATVKMPSKITMIAELTGVRKKIKYFNYEYEGVEMRVSFNDLPDQNNYYRFGVIPPIFKLEGGTHATYPLEVFSNDLIYSSTSSFQDGSTLGAYSRITNSIESFTDNSFRGKTKDILIYLDAKGFDILTSKENQKSAELILTLDNVSEDLYKYYETKNNSSENEGNPFVQPTIIHNNIRGGGIGIFGSYTQTQTVVELKI